MNMLKKLRIGALAVLGATLVLPATAEAKTTHHRRTAVVAPHATSHRDAAGYLPWREVGVATMRDFQNGNPEYQEWARAQALSQLGLNAYQVREVLDAMKNGTAEQGVIHQGDTFKAMSYYSKRQGRVIMLHKVRLTAAGEYEVSRVRLSNGRVIVIVDKCNNVGEEESAPPPPPPPAPKESTPPPPVDNTPPLPPVAPPVPVVPTKQADGFCNNLRLNAVLGAEFELNEGHARSGYGAWGIYCMKRLKDGWIGFGPAGQAAIYAGDPGDGHFNGHLITYPGIGMMRVWNKGQDLEAKLMVGDYVSNYRESDYRSHEQRTVIGLSVAFNDYSGRINGSGKPETQLFGMIGLPIGGSSEHSWQGQPLDNPSSLGLYYNLGVRRYLLPEDPKRAWNPYIQAGILGEVRSGEDFFSCSLRVGATNRRKTFGVHAGVNFCNGSVVPAIGVWYDLGNDLRQRRAARRAAAIRPDDGSGEATSEFSGTPLAATRDKK